MHIIATAGPRTMEKKILKGIIDAGANIIRINCCHSKYEDFKWIIEEARSIKNDIYIMQDLSGEKIRVSNKLRYVMKIYDGEEVRFCPEDLYTEKSDNRQYGSKKIVPLNIQSNKIDLNKINSISMKDNTILFTIIDKNKTEIIAKVINGGIVRASKGCNIKGYSRKGDLSEKDKMDLKWGAQNSVDIICQSYVERSRDLEAIREYLLQMNIKEYKPYIWAKIESEKGVQNAEEIIQNSDGILIGRGDLIPETSILEVPFYEDKIIKCACKLHKGVILGTHILDSMKDGIRPNLAEIEAIYCYINKGIVGFLLAGETSIGKAPIKTVEYLKKVIEKALENK